MELDRSLNFVVLGPIWLKFEPHGAFCEKFASATFSDHFGLVPGRLAISRPKFVFGGDPRQEVQRVGGWSRGNREERQEAVRPT